MPWSVGVADISLYDEDTHIVGGFEGGCECVGGLGRGVRCIVEHEGGAFGGKIFSDGSADSFATRQVVSILRHIICGGSCALPREPPVMTASFPSSGRAAVPGPRFVDEVRR